MLRPAWSIQSCVVTYPCTRAARSPADISGQHNTGQLLAGWGESQLALQEQQGESGGIIVSRITGIVLHNNTHHFTITSYSHLFLSLPLLLSLSLSLSSPSSAVLLSGQTVLRQTQWRPAGTFRPRACGLRKKQPVSTSQFLVVFFQKSHWLSLYASWIFLTQQFSPAFPKINFLLRNLTSRSCYDGET